MTERLPRRSGGGGGNSAAYTPLKRLSDLAFPIIIPHRGAGALLAPENTRRAYDQGVAYGLGIIDGGDYQPSMDGGLLNCHDGTVDRISNGSGNTNTMSLAGWKNHNIDAYGTGGIQSQGGPGWFGTNGPASIEPLVFDDIMDYARKVVVSPEAKSTYGGTGQRMADAITRSGLKASFLPVSDSLTEIAPLVAAGCTCVYVDVTNGLQQTAAALTAAGISWIALNSAGTSDATVTAWVNAGFTVGIYTLTRQYDYAHYLALGVKVFWLDEPLYAASLTSKYRSTVAPWTASGTYYHGHLSVTGTQDANRGSFVGAEGAWRFQQSLDGFVLQGWMCPLANAAGSYTLTVPMVWDGIPADGTRWASCYFGQATDQAFNNAGNETFGNGYNVIMRANGSLQIFKYTAGGAAQVGTTASSAAVQNVTLSGALTSGVAITALPVNALTAAVVAGQQWVLPTGQVVTASAGAASSATSIPINSVTPSATVASALVLPARTTVVIAVTPTTVTATRTDVSTANSTNATDSTWRGAYVFLGNAGHSSGLSVSFGTVAVS